MSEKGEVSELARNLRRLERALRMADFGEVARQRVAWATTVAAAAQRLSGVSNPGLEQQLITEPIAHYERALVERVAEWAYGESAERRDVDVSWERADQREWLEGARSAIRGES